MSRAINQWWIALQQINFSTMDRSICYSNVSHMRDSQETGTCWLDENRRKLKLSRDCLQLLTFVHGEMDNIITKFQCYRRKQYTIQSNHDPRYTFLDIITTFQCAVLIGCNAIHQFEFEFEFIYFAFLHCISHEHKHVQISE